MAARAPLRIGIDTGGTFTDLVVEVGGRCLHAKVPSTPEDPAKAFGEALARAGVPAGRTADVRHGTTVGTNAVLTRRGARVAFVGTAGHAEAPLLGRGERAELFQLQPGRERPLVAARHVFEAPGRLAADGSELEAITPEALEALVARVARARPEAIAVTLLHATREPRHEAAVARALRALGVPVSSGARLSAEPREVERSITAILDAFVAPLLGTYVDRLEALGPLVRGLTILRSDGGRMDVADVRREPVRTLVSGPAAGAVAAAALARDLGLPHAIGFDVGGTSTDVVWIEDGVPAAGDGLHVGPWRAGVASLGIRTVGAGGGSLVDLDPGGALAVGPDSAGAAPGPAAYGRGGPFTLTDAWLLSGHVPASLAGGDVALDRDAALEAAHKVARRAGLSLEALCRGAVCVAAGATARALRAVSAREGRDPRDAALVAFGGAGPVLGAEAARALGLRHVVVPPAPGTFAAAGTLLAPRVADVEDDVAGVRSATRLAARAKALGERARRRLGRVGGPVRVVVDAEVRHVGQEHGVVVRFGPGVEARARARHRAEFGFDLSDRPLEVLRLRARAMAGERRRRTRALAEPRARRVRGPHDAVGVEVFVRDDLRPGARVVGPARIEEATATTWVPAGCQARVDARGVLHLDLARARGSTR
ncbi:MAG: hydantoinase/oxoprolinase family protein [Planctomycetota bacterium]